MWRSAAGHDRYAVKSVPTLRARSGAAVDLAAISGDLIDLAPAWSVTSVAARRKVTARRE